MLAQMALAHHILSLHKDIQEVTILEEKAGSYIVVEEAARPGVTLLSDRVDIASRQGLLAPLVIVGTATQFAGQEPRLVGAEYENAGLILAPLTEIQLLVMSTRTESLSEVMATLSVALPKLKNQAKEAPTTRGTITSALQAEISARTFLNSRFNTESGTLFFDKVLYKEADKRWEVQGSHRSGKWTAADRFRVEVDAKDGFVKQFTISRSISSLLIVEITCVAAALLALVVFLAGFWR